MTEFRADLHIHSHCSDGTDPPLAILDLAKAAGLSGLSITDHDTFQAYTPEFYAKAEELGLQLLIGTEISTEWKGDPVHILAYHFQPELQSFLDQVVERRKNRNRKILQHLRDQGIDIAEEDLPALHIAGRPHIAQILIQRGLVSSIQEAFDRYLNDELVRFSAGGKFTPQEGVDAIHRASGKAVIAHPHLLKKRMLIKEMLELPFDGLECHYGRRLPYQEREWLEMAKRRHLIATGGSDYHGAIRSSPIGCSWVREEIFRQLKSN